MLKLYNRAVIIRSLKFTKCLNKPLPGALYSSATSYDRNYIQQSLIPTTHFQASLPRLPIPDLDKTCERYLKSQEPLVNPEELSRIKSVVSNFKNGIGKDLDAEVKALDKQNKHTSYISGPWFDMYLKDNRPVVLNHNPFMAMIDDPNSAYNEQLIRASNFIMSSARFMKSLRANLIEPDMYHMNPSKSDNDKFRSFVRRLPSFISWYGAYWYKVFPLDVSHYPGLFNATRLPREGPDTLFTDPSAKHMLIMRKGSFYIFDILDKDGNIVPENEILAVVKYILQDQTPACDFPIGIFTGEERNIWAVNRQKLEDAGNHEQLQEIDSAAFCLCLDESTTQDPIELSHIFLHGDGCNRWFDKSFSVIMEKNGKTCVNMEHSWGDGVGVLRYFNDIFDDITKRPHIHPDTQPANIDPSTKVHKLEFNLTDELKQAWRDSKRSFEKRVGGLDMNYVQFTEFGKNLIKKQNLSPDSFMQLAIQMAYYRHRGTTAPTYESCSTAAFRHGRTETVRSCTIYTKKASEMFCQRPKPSRGELLEAMKQCSNAHNELTKNAAMGQGWDRHLFALRSLAIKQNQEVEFFKDPAYLNINHIILSTSTLSSPALQIGGFAPVVPDGFGIGYGIKDEQLGCIASAYHEAQDVNGFLECMQECLLDMGDAIERKA